MSWHAWSPALALPPGSVHVVVWPLTGTAASATSPALATSADQLAWLDEKERGRAARFVFDRHRTAYVQAHLGMRRVLASYLGASPGELTFVASTRGKPELAKPQGHLRFNLSHTTGLCALALCAETDEVGVDVERTRPVEPLISQRHFSPDEQAHLANLTGEAWTAAFFRCWTRKEALLKAEGLGLHVPLASFDVSVLPDAPAALLAHRPEARLTRPWKLHHFEPETGAIGALAVSSELEPRFLRMDGPHTQGIASP